MTPPFSPPDEPTTDDLTFLTELAAPIETLAIRTARSEEFIAAQYERVADRRRTVRERIRDRAW